MGHLPTAVLDVRQKVRGAARGCLFRRSGEWPHARSLLHEPDRNRGGERDETDGPINNEHAATPFDVGRTILARPDEIAWSLHAHRYSPGPGGHASGRDRALRKYGRARHEHQDRQHGHHGEPDHSAPQQDRIVELASRLTRRLAGLPICFPCHDGFQAASACGRAFRRFFDARRSLRRGALPIQVGNWEKLCLDCAYS